MPTLPESTQILNEQYFPKHPEQIIMALNYYNDRHNYFYAPGELWKISYNDLFLGRSENPLVCGYYLIQFYNFMLLGKTELIPIYVGAPPYKDCLLDKNKDILSKICTDIDIQIWCGTADQDGVMSIKNSENNNKFYNEWGLQRPIPFEIGDTDPATLYWHLYQQGSFARWPYNSEYIYVYLMKPEEHQKLREKIWERA